MLKFVLHEELEGRNGGIPFHMFTSHALNPLCLSPLNIIYEIKANSANVKLMFILFFLYFVHKWQFILNVFNLCSGSMA